MASRIEWGILAGAVALALAASLALASVGVPHVSLAAFLQNARVYLIAWFFFAIGHVVVSLLRHRPDSPVDHLRGLYGRDFARAVACGAPLVLAIMVFMPVFSAMKSAIPLFNGYDWDATFIAWDRALHGTDPWRLLHPVLGFPIVSSALSAAYHLWVFLVYAGTVYFALYQANRALVARYFVSFLGVWTIGGVFLAIALASVGPCFVGPVLGIPVFDGQMAYLAAADRQFPVLVLEVQKSLLEWHASGDHGLGRGITAMPSMHVAFAFLFFLAMRHVHRWAGVAFGAFFVLILLASVHLGYHYAVDGYISIGLTLGVWKLSGWLVAPRARRAVVPATGFEPVAP